MADEFPATGLFHENDISADIAPIHFTGFLDIDHTITSDCPFNTGPIQIYKEKDKVYRFRRFTKPGKYETW